MNVRNTISSVSLFCKWNSYTAWPATNFKANTINVLCIQLYRGRCITTKMCKVWGRSKKIPVVFGSLANQASLRMYQPKKMYPIHPSRYARCKRRGRQIANYEILCIVFSLILSAAQERPKAVTSLAYIF